LTVLYDLPAITAHTYILVPDVIVVCYFAIFFTDEPSDRGR